MLPFSFFGLSTMKRLMGNGERESSSEYNKGMFSYQDAEDQFISCFAFLQ